MHVDGEHFDYHRWQDWYADKQRGITVNSGNYSGLPYKAAVDAIAEALARKGLGEKKTTWRLRDWGISRQRYWGTPIPIIHCDSCGSVPVPEKDLPVLLPEDLVPDGSGNPLNKCAAFLNVACPQCGKPARRETDTMDTFVDSAWYYMRYCCPGQRRGHGRRAQRLLDADGPVHRRHRARRAAPAVRALLDQGHARPGPGEVQRALHAPVHAGHAAQRASTARTTRGKKRWFYPSEVDVSYDDKGHPVGATAKADGQPVMLGGIEKMSKSKNNVVEPRDIIARFGADTARVFTMFAGPPDQSAAWSDSGAEGRVPLPAPAVGLRRALPARPGTGGRQGFRRRQPRRAATCAARCTCCCARSATTTTACNTTPWSRAR
jgi:leucyl-tRNA synthetase